MAASRKQLGFLFLILAIFSSGCDLESASTPMPVATELSTPQLILTPISISTLALTSTPTKIPTDTPSATPTMLPTVTVSSTPSNPASLGLSTGGYPIEIYRYGNGPIPVILIGGIHGGYEWNTILLAYELIDYFDMNTDFLSPQLTVYIIPSANPDGQVRVVGQAGRFSANDVKGDTFDGRFNGNGVDLNRNWDCDWSPVAFWRDTKLDPGKEPFSEVETRLLRDFILEQKPAGVIFWHSAYPAVFPGGCNSPYEPSRLLAETYAGPAGYPALDSFTSYEVTGDSTNWLALQDIPSIEVELTDHEETEFDRNLKGVLGVLDFLANQPIATPAMTQPAP
jgi:hypothetical protein